MVFRGEPARSTTMHQGGSMNDRDHNPFVIAGGSPKPVSSGAATAETDHSVPAIDRVRRMISSADVFLFMKGEPSRPMCGFSANTVAILESSGVPYSSFDVLSDEAVRQAAKEHGSWPTFPQLWVRGELVGGNDIVTEMAHTGELQSLLDGAAS
jgi:monothiol glutaredoxin